MTICNYFFLHTIFFIVSFFRRNLKNIYAKYGILILKLKMLAGFKQHTRV